MPEPLSSSLKQRSVLSNTYSGFSLIEMLFAMAISSSIFLATMKIIPILYKNTVQFSQQQRLAQLFHQTLQRIEKDLQRAGFCAGTDECEGIPIKISQAPGEQLNSCLLVSYDLNKNGQWEPSGDDAETFAYRLKQGALEIHRGVTDCEGNGWEKIVDQHEVFIHSFTIDPSRIHSVSMNKQRMPEMNGIYTLQIDGRWANNTLSTHVNIKKQVIVKNK